MNDPSGDTRGAEGDSAPNRRFQIGPPERTRALVLVPWLKSGEKAAARSADARLEEATGLALAIDLEIVDGIVVPVTAPRPATLIGPGKVEDLAGTIAAFGVELVVVDGTLTPVQQRNLERAWNAKVLDRTGLILEIFGERARTREGRLQVELAHLTYQKSRLVRSWTHLERQRGGFGFLGGPGETQIEADRRVIQDRIRKIERQLETVKRTRELHRKKRRDVPYPVVALVGYTNAGKSTLFNRLTESDVLAQDLLFATLDPTMRAVSLPSGRKIILSDTVGFISDLPTHLVAAFRATLEEVLEAEVILHVRDIAHPQTDAQHRDVLDVLDSLGIGEDRDERMVEVMNKADLLPEAERGAVENLADRDVRKIVLSALTGEGIEKLLALLDRRFDARTQAFTLVLDAGDAAALAWLHEHAEVRSRENLHSGEILLHVALTAEDRGRFEKRFPRLAATLHPTAEAAE